MEPRERNLDDDAPEIDERPGEEIDPDDDDLLDPDDDDTLGRPVQLQP